jgi:hypothetical protein
MPPRKRADNNPADEAPQTAAAESAEEQPQTEAPAPRKPRKPAADPPCPNCFPGGWPEEATSAGCGHGTWNRDL